MNVLLLNQAFHPDPSATSQQIADLAQYLTGRGCKVTVICDQRAYDTRDLAYKKEETWKGVRIVRVASTIFGKTRFRNRIVNGFFFELRAFFRLLTLPRQHVVIAFTSPPLIGVLGGVYRFLFRARFIQWLMDINPDAAFSRSISPLENIRGGANQPWMTSRASRGSHLPFTSATP